MAESATVTRMPERQRVEQPARRFGALGPTAPMLGALRGEVDSLFDRFLGGSGLERGWPGDASPSSTLWRDHLGQTDISETASEYEIQIDLPGMNRDNVQIDYADGTIIVSGERSDERRDERQGYYLSERSYGSFRRSFRVPENVDADRIGAQFHDGVLSIRLPKTEEAVQNTRRIEVQ